MKRSGEGSATTVKGKVREERRLVVFLKRLEFEYIQFKEDSQVYICRRRFDPERNIGSHQDFWNNMEVNLRSNETHMSIEAGAYNL